MSDNDTTERLVTTETAPETSGQDSTRTFTQADLDRVAGERARRAAESAATKLLAQLGVEDVNTAAELLREYRQRQEADMTEAQKAKAEIDKVRKEADALKAALEAERAERLADRRDAALRAALTDADKPAAVLTLLKGTFAAEVDAVMTADGTLDDKAVAALAQKAAKEWPGLFRSNAPGSPSNSDGRMPKPDVGKVLDHLPKLRL